MWVRRESPNYQRLIRIVYVYRDIISKDDKLTFETTEALMATTENRLRANRRNALESTGPKTEEGRDIVKSNAIRHGLRCVQTVVPGESADEWDDHRDAIVADPNPQGVIELALADQVAAGLWRLGRVIRFESDAIAIGQDPAELAHLHEKARYRGNGVAMTRTDIPTRKDVEKARDNAKAALEKVSELQSALRQLESLAGMEDGAVIEDWSIFDPLRRDLRLEDARRTNFSTATSLSSLAMSGPCSRFEVRSRKLPRAWRRFGGRRNSRSSKPRARPPGRKPRVSNGAMSPAWNDSQEDGDCRTTRVWRRSPDTSPTCGGSSTEPSTGSATSRRPEGRFLRGDRRSPSPWSRLALTRRWVCSAKMPSALAE